MFLSDPFWSPVASVLIAITGGVARQFYEQLRHPRKKWSRWQFSREIFIAFFCGIMALILALFTGITGYGIHLICGTAGWTSPNILTLISRKTEKLAGGKEGELSGERKE